MTPLIFIRHGESEANVTRTISNRDLPHGLTERGREQVRELKQRLRDKAVAAIYASPIPRAQETARLLADGREVITADALREFDCGVAEGRSDAEAWQLHDRVVDAWDAGRHDERIEGGESYRDVHDRFVPFIRALAQSHQDAAGAVLLVTHGSMLYQMLPAVLSNVDRDFVRRHPLHNCAQVVVEARGRDLSCVDWAGTVPEQ